MKYPVMFQKTDCWLITKIDLASYLDIDIQKITDNVIQTKLSTNIIPASAKTGEGLGQGFDWMSELIEHRCSQQLVIQI